MSVRPVKDVSGNIPDKLKLAIGDAVSLFSLIDSCALEIVWLILGADLAMKKKLAKERAFANLKTFEDAISQIPDVDSSHIFAVCRELRRQRNLIAHGVWQVDDAGIPHVTLHSHYLESDDYAVIEEFSYERFASFIESGLGVLGAFNEAKQNLEKVLPGKWPAIADMEAERSQACFAADRIIPS
jgi:hypothetical protein